MREVVVEEIEASKASFRDRLVSDASPLTIVREFITHGSCLVIDDAEYTSIRERAGDALGVNPNQSIYVVGSAKLGFSIKKSRRYGLFGDDSDIDLAVVAPTIYELLWEQARRYTREGGLWEADTKVHFRNDHFRAVIKPYVLPDSDSIQQKRVLFDLQSSLQRLGSAPYPVTIAVWHSLQALEEYQMMTVAECQEELKL